MLKLKRKTGDGIIFLLPSGEEIRIELEVHTKNCYVCINAPDNVKILRSELVDEPEVLGHLWKGDR